MDPTPIPVKITGLSAEMWDLVAKADDAYKLAMWSAALSVFILVALVTALVVTSGLRRHV